MEPEKRNSSLLEKPWQSKIRVSKSSRLVLAIQTGLFSKLIIYTDMFQNLNFCTDILASYSGTTFYRSACIRKQIRYVSLRQYLRNWNRSEINLQFENGYLALR